MGLGMVLIVDAAAEGDVKAALAAAGERVHTVGRVVPGSGAVAYERA